MLLLLACKPEPHANPVPLSETSAWTCENPTELVTFQEVSTQWGLQDTTDDWIEVGELGVGSGPVMADWDQDGDDDLLLGVRTQGFFFHWNEGDHFRIEKLDWEVVGLTATTLDLNRDGVLDLLLAGADHAMAGNTVQIFWGDGRGGFTRASEPLLTNVFSVLGMVGSDYDGDGLLDLFLTLSGGDMLLHGQSDGSFEDIGPGLGLAELSQRSWMGLWLDANVDGQEDIVITNDMQNEGPNTTLLLNQGDTFTATEFDPPPVNSMGASVFDANADGIADLYIAGTSYNELYINDGAGQFVEVGRANGAMGEALSVQQMSLGTLPIDFDIDGDTDIVSIGGRAGLYELAINQDEVEPDQLLVNADGMFSNQAPLLGFGTDEDGRTVSMGFLSPDGTPDLIVGQIGVPSKLYQSSCTEDGSVLVELQGTTDTPNGLGAKVTLVTSEGIQTGWVTNASGLNGHKNPAVFFGYGDASLEKIEIEWPSGLTQIVWVDPEFSGILRVPQE